MLLKNSGYSKEWDYPIHYTDISLLNASNGMLEKAIGGRRCIVFTTPTVYRHYGQAFEDYVFERSLRAPIEVVYCSEVDKGMKQLEKFCSLFKKHNIDREGVLISFSGGVCSDILTVGASLIRRGVRYIKIPTTLIGQIDAGIGIKGAVNFQQKKSYLGCFHAPNQVLIDPSFLKTLPKKHLRYGFAEIFKMGLIKDKKLFDLVKKYGSSIIENNFSQINDSQTEILNRAIKSMMSELEVNFCEDKTYERLVDFGHTVSPVLESKQKFKMHHGEAVSIDMALSTVLSNNLGLISSREKTCVLHLLNELGLPVFSPALDVDAVVQSFMDASAHRGGNINLVVPLKIGKGVFLRRRDEIPLKVIEKSIDELLSFHNNHQQKLYELVEI